MKSILVCGSRNGAAFGEVERAMDLARRHLAMLGHTFDHVVVGSRKGVDGRAFEWAVRAEIASTVVPAMWRTGERGKGEGPIRNRRMLALFRPENVLAFPGGTGTEDMVAAAKLAHVPVWRWLGRDLWRLDETPVQVR